MRLSAYGEVSDLGCINTQKKLCTRSRFAQKNYRCGIFWMLPGKFSFPDGSEYVWQRGVEGVKGQVTGGRSWPSFRKKNFFCGVKKTYVGRSDLSLQAQFQKVWEICFLLHLLVLLTDHTLSPSTNFGRPKQSQNCPAANFRPKAFVPLCIPAFPSFMSHHNTSFQEPQTRVCLNRLFLGDFWTK